MKITKKKNSRGQEKFYIKHNLISNCSGEYFDDYYSAQKRLKELGDKR
jgi:hypothetical protein